MYRKELTENYLVLEDEEVIKAYKSQECAENYVRHLLKKNSKKTYEILKIEKHSLITMNQRVNL